jgi:hypothetical protein
LIQPLCDGSSQRVFAVSEKFAGEAQQQQEKSPFWAAAQFLLEKKSKMH